MTLRQAQGAFTEMKNMEDWQKAKKQSFEQSVLIVKHSVTCPISMKAFARIESGIAEGILTCPVYVVVVQTAREVSNQIEKDMDIDHESPQVLVVKDGKSLYDTSHLDIDAQTIVSFL
jgi:bacillithiol system protein YtxJ